MLRVCALPARHGDCVWIDYGDAENPRRLLIDGGTTGTYDVLKAHIGSLPRDRRRFDLLIVTHVDSDHIGGALKLLKDDSLGVEFADVWFNGFRHLPGSAVEEFGPVQGERLTTRLLKTRRWNLAFDGKAVMTSPAGLPSHTLPDGLTLTLLSPDATKLQPLRSVWDIACRKAGLDPSLPEPAPPPPGIEAFGAPPLPDVESLAAVAFKEDAAVANGSSIAVLLEFENRRVMLSADAHPTLLRESIERIVGKGKRLSLDLFKLPHHGSRANVCRELLESLDVHRYLVSTNGDHFSHPDPEAMARVIKFGGATPTLIFNYRSSQTAIWDNAKLRERFKYDVVFPSGEDDGVFVDL